jgi:hypothetical protein
MTNENGRANGSLEVLSYAITRLHPGKHVIFSEEEQRVIGVGDTPEEAAAQAEASGVGGLWHFGYGEQTGIRKI